jgi:hypothetical protein
MRVWALFRKYIKAMNNGEDICWFIWDEETRMKCYAVTSTSDEHRRTKLRNFKVILTERFWVKREEILEILRGVLDFMIGLELTNEELALLIRQAHQ